MQREPLLIPALGFIAGVFAAHFFFFDFSDLRVPAAVAAMAVLVAVFRCGRRVRAAVACACLFLAGIGAQIVHRAGKAPNLDTADGDTALLDGCVVNPPVFSPDREQFTLQIGRRARIRLTAAIDDAKPVRLSYGLNVEVAAKVRRPRNFNNPGAFDYAGYLAQQNIFWTGSISDPASIRRLPGSCGHSWLAGLYGVRTWALDRLGAAYPKDVHTRGLLAATLLGETSGVERQWTDEFRSTGTYHALVISGLHVWIVTASLLLLLRWCGMRKLQALFIGAITSWGYAFIAGGNAPVIRAAAGYTLFFAGAFFFRRTRLLNLLAATAIGYLAIDPEALFDAAFQLSFLSAAAIACFAIPLIGRYVEPLRGALKRFDQVRYDALVEWRAAVWRVEFRLLAQTAHVWTGLRPAYAQVLVKTVVLGFVFVAEAALLSACVQFALALPMVSYFHRLSATGLSANVIVVPLLTLVVPAGFLTILTGWHWLAVAAATLLHWAEATAVWHLHFEPAWRMGAVPLPVALLFCCSLLLLALVTRHIRRLAPLAFGTAVLFFAGICLQPWNPLIHKGKLEVTAIDVGQGDSLLIAFPDGETMLVDAGGAPGLERMKRKPRLDVGEDVVSPYLWDRRIRHLDYVVVTHGHSDHMAGMAAVLDNFRPGALLTGAEPATREWGALVARAAVDRVRILQLHRGVADRVIGGVRVRVLAPSPDYQPAPEAKNDDSLVLELTYGERSVLLTGDAEHPVEEELAASGLLHGVTLLKVGHHGSRTSSSEDFLAQLAPRLAFISDGYMNQFHHPHPQVLQRLADHHAAVFRTDTNGLLTFETDGSRFEVTSFR